jgi:hypothetical protein
MPFIRGFTWLSNAGRNVRSPTRADRMVMAESAPNWIVGVNSETRRTKNPETKMAVVDIIAMPVLINVASLA